MSDLKVVTVKVSNIVPYWRNPRRNDRTVRELRKSIEEFGFNVPVLLDKSGVIIAGHARYRALLEMGVTEIPCVISDMDATKAKEYRIADNKIHELSNWVVDGLLKEVKDSNFAMSIPGFLAEDVESMFPTNIDTPFQNVSESEEGAEAGGQGDSGATGDAGQAGEAPTEEEATLVLMCPHCFTHREYSKTELLAGVETEATTGGIQ